MTTYVWDAVPLVGAIDSAHASLSLTAQESTGLKLFFTSYTVPKPT
jgi:hypothetical protein